MRTNIFSQTTFGRSHHRGVQTESAILCVHNQPMQVRRIFHFIVLCVIFIKKLICFVETNVNLTFTVVCSGFSTAAKRSSLSEKTWSTRCAGTVSDCPTTILTSQITYGTFSFFFFYLTQHKPE